MLKLITSLALLVSLVACGGGAVDEALPDQLCNPDQIDCMYAYGDKYPHAFESTDANWQVFTFSDTPRAGWVLIK